MLLCIISTKSWAIWEMPNMTLIDCTQDINIYHLIVLNKEESEKLKGSIFSSWAQTEVVLGTVFFLLPQLVQSGQ